MYAYIRTVFSRVSAQLRVSAHPFEVHVIRCLRQRPPPPVNFKRPWAFTRENTVYAIRTHMLIHRGIVHACVQYMHTHVRM